MKKSKNPASLSHRPRILVAPLDWGLGHSTRCIPIIKELILQGCEVYIVADKKRFYLLKKEFPDTVLLRYKGYEIEYSRQNRFLIFKLLFQIPKVFLRVIAEKKWLEKIIEQNNIDAVVSDNRFGMYNKRIPSVYLTHQLYIKTGNQIVEQIAQRIHYFFLKKFTACWVPDSKENGLAGELSHPKKLPQNITYIGPLSRFRKDSNEEKIYDLLIILSGPEPQRTIFENKIFADLKTINANIFLIRGLPGETNKPKSLSNVLIENHLDAAELNATIEKSKMVLCRSGYTSVMDLSVLKKKAILVPTPGQTEQEYLATYLMSKGYFFSMSQKEFSLKKAMEGAASFNFNPPNIMPDFYKKTVDEFVLSLKSGSN